MNSLSSPPLGISEAGYFAIVAFQTALVVAIGYLIYSLIRFRAWTAWPISALLIGWVVWFTLRVGAGLTP
jgi:hypothetical protein